MTIEYVNPDPLASGNSMHTPVEVLPVDAAMPLSGKAAQPVVALPVQGAARTWADVAYRAQDWLGVVGRWSWKLCKLGICAGLDLADMVMVGWIGINPIFEVGAALITMALWGGKKGVWAFAELADFTELLDPWIPTCTIIALASWNND